MQVVSWASTNCLWPALLERERMEPVAAHTATQSRLRRMQAIRRWMSPSDIQASAQAVQISTQLKHASMAWLISVACAGFTGCDRNMARTADMRLSRERSRFREERTRCELVPAGDPRTSIEWNLCRFHQVQELRCPSSSRLRNLA